MRRSLPLLAFASTLVFLLACQPERRAEDLLQCAQPNQGLFNKAG